HNPTAPRLSHTHPHPTTHFYIKHTPTTDSYTLSLHDALPIYTRSRAGAQWSDQREASRDGEGVEQRLHDRRQRPARVGHDRPDEDRKSTRLNSSHSQISYAVFCLKKKKNIN